MSVCTSVHTVVRVCVCMHERKRERVCVCVSLKNLNKGQHFQSISARWHFYQHFFIYSSASNNFLSCCKYRMSPRQKRKRKVFFLLIYNSTFPSLHFFLFCHILLTSKISLTFFFFHFISSFCPFRIFLSQRLFFTFLENKLKVKLKVDNFNKKGLAERKTILYAIFNGDIPVQI